MTAYPPIVSRFGFSQTSLEKLRAAAQTDIHVIEDREEFNRSVKDAEIICGFLPKNWREMAPRLRWLQSPAAGIDSLRENSILTPDSGVLVTTGSGIHVTNISEYVFGSMIMFNRAWPQLVDMQRRHAWPRNIELYFPETYQVPFRERELHGQTLAIIGMGNIGRRIAQVARAFGMRVLATRHSAKDGEQDPDVDQLFPQSRMLEVLQQSDYVVIAVPLTRDTEKLIGERELRAMQAHAYLVNIARGKVIDEEVLLRALQEGWIAGAGLDVTATEPLPAESPLYDLPNVILTPHISGATEHYEARLADLFSDNLRRYRAGQPLRNVYEHQRGY
ncbi:D-2-hydroxyacid dehydrogenase [Ktedonobacter racemifer]|uniref:D-isomer specific 2-hydroxyacid dehydrogenase NAD-binding n=1 Tax=Ktedonobacter racemifer DSM 44963 TaxID=485913 RepID=D6TM53_KTERA|nr:D-2-hydroxyacid dehydrogenase [Ktedonobacter racemifer]EFH86853.1 D-isomer specific 2-hydroxyacid dehydrogenase NAD-binding [Ktedonobacter racemifer DSM 44963]